MKDLLECKCHECQSYYDTEHHKDCPYKDKSLLVEYDHVLLEEDDDVEESQYDLVK